MWINEPRKLQFLVKLCTNRQIKKNTIGKHKRIPNSFCYSVCFSFCLFVLSFFAASSFFSVYSLCIICSVLSISLSHHKFAFAIVSCECQKFIHFVCSACEHGLSVCVPVCMSVCCIPHDIDISQSFIMVIYSAAVTPEVDRITAKRKKYSAIAEFQYMANQIWHLTTCLCVRVRCAYKCMGVLTSNQRTCNMRTISYCIIHLNRTENEFRV